MVLILYFMEMTTYHSYIFFAKQVVWMESFYPRSSFTNGICDCCASGWRNACLVFICQPCARASARTRMNGTNWWVSIIIFFLSQTFASSGPSRKHYCRVYTMVLYSEMQALWMKPKGLSALI